MIDEFSLYLITRADAVSLSEMILTNILGGVTVVLTIIRLLSEGCFRDKEPEKRLEKMIKGSTVAFLVSLTLFTITPTTKELLVIYGVPMALRSEFGTEAKKVPTAAMKLINQYIEDKLRKETEDGN